MRKLFENWEIYLEELVNPESVDVSSFEIQDELNSDVWERGKLKSKIKNKLYKVANDFFESLGLHWVKILDITITGSLANYTWSKYSDIDLHIIIDYKEVDENFELVGDFLRKSSSIWNKNHNIKIKGFEVELYVQNSGEPHHSTGVYSIIDNGWVTEPSKENPKIDYINVKKKAARLMEDIDEVYEMFSNKEYKLALNASEQLREKIRKFRQCGLETRGAFSVENLAFKVLRRNDYLQKLSSLRILSYDKMMSINGNNIV